MLHVGEYAVSPAVLAARLNEAAQAGRPLTILYRDASEPRRTHRIVPIGASSRVLRARDLASNRQRVFLLTQLELPEDEPDAAVASREPAVASRMTCTPSERETLAVVVDELNRLGCHVALSNRRLSVHALYSSGTPAKGAAAYIARTEAPRRRWSVMAPGMPRRVPLARLEEAVALFMAHVRLHAPRLRRPQDGRPLPTTVPAARGRLLP